MNPNTERIFNLILGAFYLLPSVVENRLQPTTRLEYAEATSFKSRQAGRRAISDKTLEPQHRIKLQSEGRLI